jgi:hypothetical protein
VSIQEERELSQRLGDLLGGIEPGQAPFGPVIRQGQGIKRRRRAVVAGSLAVVAAGAVLGPTVLRNQLTPPPPAAQTPHYTVTVSPPGQGAKPGVIATGSINGWHWQATLSGSRSDVSATFGNDFNWQPGDPVPLPGEFASFDSERIGPRTAYLGPVAADVRYLTASLSNGQTLTLYPRPWDGHRYLAMVLPEKLQVITVVAFGAGGELGSSIPFNYQGSATVGIWLRPGQRGMARATTRIGAGGSGKSRWAATAYVGPWGLCGEVSGDGGGGGFCIGGRPALAGLVSGQFGSGPGGVEIGLARRDVAYLLITRSDGSVIRLSVAHVPGYADGLTAVIRPGHPAFRSWVAYDAAGKRLGSGKGDPVGFH